ncbi:SMI1/KNR4 family protein [Clostridiaceae bacterium HSG29]|nr:SMI1/KNR4 family protein [Clostridiaceae bacterium HSG29]
MTEIIKSFQEKSDLLSGKGVSEELIENAENILGLKFADEYKEYLLHFGVVAFDGHELTGISSIDRLDVIKVTLNELQKNAMVPTKMYVIEVANIDGIIIWQSSEGDIYETIMDTKPIKICDSISEYINL